MGVAGSRTELPIARIVEIAIRVARHHSYGEVACVVSHVVALGQEEYSPEYFRPTLGKTDNQ